MPSSHRTAQGLLPRSSARSGATGAVQANLSRVLAGTGVEALGKDDGKRIGELLALTGSADIVDAHVALMTAPGDLVRRRY